MYKSDCCSQILATSRLTSRLNDKFTEAMTLLGWSTVNRRRLRKEEHIVVRNSSHVRDFDNRIRVSKESLRSTQNCYQKLSNALSSSSRHCTHLTTRPNDAKDASKQAIHFTDEFRHAIASLTRRGLHFSRWPSSRSAAPSDLAIPNCARHLAQAFLARCRKRTRNAAAC